MFCFENIVPFKNRVHTEFGQSLNVLIRILAIIFDTYTHVRNSGGPFLLKNFNCW